MATVVNFIDTTLQSAATRTVPVAGTTAVDWQSAATTSTWAGTTGTGKPADNATVGAIIGANLSGQFTAANAATFIASSAISQAMLAAGIIDLTKFASGIEPVTMVTSVPGTKSTYSIFNTTDGKLYRWNGTAYVATVAASDLSGTLADAQIAALAASKITGTLSDSQLAAIAAAKITGQIVTTQITDGGISTPKLAAGAVTAAKIAADTITANEISAGAITSSELAAGAVIAGKITAGTIVSADIAADTITAANIAANAITASELSADSVVAGKIAAAAISAREIAAGAITVGKLAVISKGQAINDDPAIEDASAWQIPSGVTLLSGTTAPGAAGGNYFSNTSTPSAVTLSLRACAVDPAKTYNLNANVFAATGNNRAVCIFVDFYDASGAHLSTASPNWGGSYSGYVYNAVPPADNTFHRVGASFGVATANPIPSAAALMKVGHITQSGGTSSVQQAVQDIRLERVNDATLIQDGAITTNKILAGAVTADRINVTNLAAITAELGSAVISTTGSLSSGQTAYNTGTGWWIGLVGGVAKMSMGVAGGAGFTWDGSTFTINNATVAGGTINSPTINTPILATQSVGGMVNVSTTGANGVSRSITRTANPSGGRAPYTFLWVETTAGGMIKLSNTTSATVTITANGTSETQTGVVACTATDANGIAISGSLSVAMTFA